MRNRHLSLDESISRKYRSSFRKLLVESLEDRRLLTGVPDFNAAILADLNDTVLSSNPTAAVKVQNTIYFSATSEEHGAELWSTDGTTAGSTLVADLVSGPMSGKPRNLTALGNQLIFVSDFSEAGSPNQSIGLFSYDGASVVRLATLTEFSSGMGDNTAIFILGDQAIVLMQNMMGTSLWRTNGQIAGTNLLSNNLITGFTNVLTPSYSSAILGNVLLINIPIDEMSGTSAVVRTDGTIVGTQVLRNSESSFSPTPLKRELVVAGGKAFFTSNSSLDGLGLYATDGTVAGTSKVLSIGDTFSMAALGSMVDYDGQLYFSYNNGFDGFELWKSDGTVAGTSLAVDLAPGFENGIESSLFVWQGHLYFAGRVNGKIELWKSNGTSAGTNLVYDSSTPFGLTPMRFAALANAFVFDAMDGSLWSSNGTSAGTQKISDFSASEYVVSGGQLFYIAQSTGYGRELWRTDGTVNGTLRLSDLNPGVLDGVEQILATTGSGIIFRGTGDVGTEIGFSDGSVAGTYLIDTAQGTPPSNVVDYIAVGDDYYVSLNNGQQQLLKVNRVTGAKTVLRSFGFTAPTGLTHWNGHVYFAAYGQSTQGVELWRTDGTTNGTVLWKDLNAGNASSNPRNFTVFNNRLFFTATTAATGNEMWEVSLGDARATLYKEFTPGSTSSDISAIQVIGQHMYVLADSVLYNTVSTGALNTPPLSVLHSNVARGSLMPWESSLYFAGSTPQHGFELWRTNGTVGGTFMVADLVPGPESSYPGSGVSVEFGAESGGAGVESKLIFRASIAENNHQLWATDGTTQGTERLTNYAVTPGAFGNVISYLPLRLNSLGGVVVYEAYDPVNGRELWVSNGTTEGTKLLANLRPGAFPDPNLTVEPEVEPWKWEPIRESIVLNGRLYFRLDDGSRGPELWTTDGTVAGTGIAVDLIDGAQGGFPTRFKIINNRLHFTADTREFGLGNFEGTGELFVLNEAPELSDHTAVIAPGATLTYSLNGYDADGDVLNYEIVVHPSHGVASISGGVLTYTPPVGFTGFVTMQVRATDGSAKSDIAAVGVSVIANPNRVSFATSQSSIVEQNGVARLIVQLAQPAQELIEVPYAVTGATAVANSNEASGVVTFVAGQQSAEILVYVRENNRYQAANQHITVALKETAHIGLGAIGTHTVTIVDNDSQPLVSFPDNWKTIVEEDVVEGIYVGLSHPSDETVTVTVSLFANSGATAGVDYMAASQTVLVFAPGQVRKMIPVRIMEDSITEVRESILAQISAVTNTSVVQNPDKFRHLLFIQDDDTSLVSLSPSNQVLVEGNTAQITLTRSGGNMSLPLQVNYTFSGQAQLGSDFTSPSGTSFTFAAGQTEATNTFLIAADGTVEGFEDFTLILSSSPSYILGEQSWSYVGIFDANMLSPKLTVSHTDIYERKASNGQNRTVDVTVTLSSPSDETVSIPVRLRYENVRPPVQPPPFFPPPPPPPPNSAGFNRRPQLPPPPPPPIQQVIPDSIARLGTDFSFDTSNFVFPPGTTSITRQLEILDDFEIEGDEKIGISIDKGSFLAPETHLNAEIILRNDDRSLELSGLNSIKEGDGSLVITATLNEEADIPIAYPIQISGTANVFGNPKDVTFAGLNPESPILIFNAGEKTKQFTVNVINDTRFEPTKNLKFTAWRISGSEEKIVAQHEVQIHDDERPPTVSFGTGDGSRISYDADSSIIPIRLSGAPGMAAEIELEFAGTAKLGIDYEIISRLKPGFTTIEVGSNTTEAFLVIRPLIAIDSLPKTIEVSIVGGSNITVPSATPKTSRTLYSPFAALFQPRPSSIDAVIPGQLPFTIGQSVNIAASNSAGTAPSLNGVSNQISTSTGSLMISTGAQGLLAGSASFLDLNFNGRRDFLDLNENLRQDDNEPSEPSATTNADGTFVFTLTPGIDRDGSGFLEPSEGRIVLVGGTDTSTALPWEIQLTSPAGNFGVTPLSTLVEHVVRRGGLSFATAMQRVTDALDIPNYSLGNNLAIHQILNGDPLAELAYARQVQISSLAILAGKLAQGAGGSVERGADRAFAAMADRILQNGTNAIFSEVSFVRGVLRAVNNELENPVSEITLDNLATLIARSLASLDNINSTQFESPLDYLERVTQIKKLLHGELANDVKTFVEGAATFTALNSKYSNAGINALVPLQTIGDVVPPAIGVRNAFVLEGHSGQSSLVFEVAMLGEHKLPVSVSYSTRDGSAIVGEDYLLTSGVLTWAAGDSTSRFVSVPIIGDVLSEQDEYLLLRLSQPEGVAVRVADGYGYILNDDAIIVSLTGNEDLNRVYIDRSIDQLVVIENNQVIRDLMLAMAGELTLNSSSNTSTAFEFLFSESNLRSDFFEVVGSAQGVADSIAYYGSQLASLIHGGLEGSTSAFKLQSASEGGESIIAYQNIEQVESHFDAVDRVQLRIGKQTASATVADANAMEAGSSMFTVPGSGFTFRFRNPRSSIQIVSFHPNFTLTPSVLDPSFTGDVQVLRGGTLLSTTIVDKLTLPNTTVTTFSTEDPMFVGSPVFELVNGDGDSGNAYFIVEGTGLKLVTPLAGVTTNTLSVRVKLSNELGESVEQIFTLDIEGASNNSPTDFILSTLSINENLPGQTIVGTFTTVDPDIGDTFTYQLVEGAGDDDNVSFTINGNQLRATTAFNFETKPTYKIRVRSTDAEGLFVEKQLTISVVDLPELVGGVVVGDGSNQRSHVTQVSVTLDGLVEIEDGAFSVIKRGASGGPVSVSAHATVNVNGQTVVTISFSGPFTRGTSNALLDGYYQLTINGSKINRLGQSLDGNQDGIGGDVVLFGDEEVDKFFALYGDTSGDGQVGLTEYGQFRSSFGRSAGQPGYNVFFDYDGGGILLTDFGQFRSRFGRPKLAWQ